MSPPHPTWSLLSALSIAGVDPPHTHTLHAPVILKRAHAVLVVSVERFPPLFIINSQTLSETFLCAVDGSPCRHSELVKAQTGKVSIGWVLSHKWGPCVTPTASQAQIRGEVGQKACEIQRLGELAGNGVF